MTLTIIDSKSGTRVTHWYADLPPTPRTVPAVIVRHPRVARA
jgi:hypothetical protein